MRDVNKDMMPDPTGYKIDVDEVESFTVGDFEMHPLVFNNEIHSYLNVGEPGAVNPWHTHVPTYDQIAICRAGEGRFTIEQRDGSHQVIETEPGDVVYLPGGIHHQIESIGDEPFEYYAINQSMRHGRLEMLFEDWDGYADFEEWPVALWIDRERDEIIQKNEPALSEE